MEKKFIRDLTMSGDFYSATREKWDEYNEAINNSDYKKVMHLEEGNDPDFFYDPE